MCTECATTVHNCHTGPKDHHHVCDTQRRHRPLPIPRSTHHHCQLAWPPSPFSSVGHLLHYLCHSVAASVFFKFNISFLCCLAISSSFFFYILASFSSCLFLLFCSSSCSFFLLFSSLTTFLAQPFPSLDAFCQLLPGSQEDK